jgi:hypothetical protein
MYCHSIDNLFYLLPVALGLMSVSLKDLLLGQTKYSLLGGGFSNKVKGNKVIHVGKLI